MKYELSQKFFFDAAHTLRRQIETELSARIHGHTYSAEVAVEGAPDAESGMVVDLGLLRNTLAVLRERLDHQFLDTVEGLGAATLENLCTFIFEALRTSGFAVSRVSVWREGIGDRCDLRLE
ncbi:6-carboxy-5,6,7,8-tetrahydropterin synthase [mine drainage metagenome]|uniref:6-carboxy-5,6,7,8-tetrahydropterin synthase n=1 Tax=mine drainage metagenome TaxID=410659 RepID=A0A1J5PUN9_9ZZZZ